MGFHRISCCGLLVSFFIAKTSYKYFFPFSAWFTNNLAENTLNWSKHFHYILATQIEYHIDTIHISHPLLCKSLNEAHIPEVLSSHNPYILSRIHAMRYGWGTKQLVKYQESTDPPHHRSDGNKITESVIFLTLCRLTRQTLRMWVGKKVGKTTHIWQNQGGKIIRLYKQDFTGSFHFLWRQSGAERAVCLLSGLHAHVLGKTGEERTDISVESVRVG